MNLILEEEVAPLREIVSVVAILRETDISPLSKWLFLDTIIYEQDYELKSNITPPSAREKLMDGIRRKAGKLEEEYLAQQSTADHDNA